MKLEKIAILLAFLSMLIVFNSFVAFSQQSRETKTLLEYIIELEADEIEFENLPESTMNSLTGGLPINKIAVKIKIGISYTTYRNPLSRLMTLNTEFNNIEILSVRLNGSPLPVDNETLFGDGFTRENKIVFDVEYYPDGKIYDVKQRGQTLRDLQFIKEFYEAISIMTYIPFTEYTETNKWKNSFEKSLNPMALVERLSLPKFNAYEMEIDLKRESFHKTIIPENYRMEDKFDLISSFKVFSQDISNLFKLFVTFGIGGKGEFSVNKRTLLREKGKIGGDFFFQIDIMDLEDNSARILKPNTNSGKILINGKYNLLIKEGKLSNADTIKTQEGLLIKRLRSGSGQTALFGDTVSIKYTASVGYWAFDTEYKNKPLTLQIGAGEVIPGLELAIEGMKVGEKRKVKVPAELGFKNSENSYINEKELVYEIELISVE